MGGLNSQTPIGGGHPQSESENSARPSGFRKPNWELGMGSLELLIGNGGRKANYILAQNVLYICVF